MQSTPYNHQQFFFKGKSFAKLQSLASKNSQKIFNKQIVSATAAADQETCEEQKLG